MARHSTLLNLFFFLFSLKDIQYRRRWCIVEALISILKLEKHIRISNLSKLCQKVIGWYNLDMLNLICVKFSKFTFMCNIKMFEAIVQIYNIKLKI